MERNDLARFRIELTNSARRRAPARLCHFVCEDRDIMRFWRVGSVPGISPGHDRPMRFGRAALFVWELPQNVLGLSLLGVEALTRSIVDVRFERERVMIESKGQAISLGLFVFWCRTSNRWHDLDERNRDHEYGHSIQSRRLGPLYLPLVGVPSTARALYALAYREITGRKWSRYYAGYPERWADQLGGVRRD